MWLSLLPTLREVAPWRKSHAHPARPGRSAVYCGSGSARRSSQPTAHDTPWVALGGHETRTVCRARVALPRLEPEIVVVRDRRGVRPPALFERARKRRHHLVGPLPSRGPGPTARRGSARSTASLGSARCAGNRESVHEAHPGSGFWDPGSGRATRPHERPAGGPCAPAFSEVARPSDDVGELTTSSPANSPRKRSPPAGDT